MWNENAPLELLSAKSNGLTEKNLSEIQNIIDWDKYINSSIMHMDLCGSYAPFCDGCDKSQKYPCAMAYINMKKAEGMNITFENEQEPVAEEALPEELPVEQPEAAVSVNDNISEQPVEPARESTSEQHERIGRIRIAIARRKR